MLAAFNFMIAMLLGVGGTEAVANQWVLGNVKTASDNSAYSSSYGIIVELNGATWGSGSTSNGPSTCTQFRIVVGLQGVTEPEKQRFWGALLTQKALGQSVALYVDTSNGALCAIQVLAVGFTAAP